MGGCATSPASSPAAATREAPMSLATGSTPPALDAIREEDLRRDIFFLASDAMRGREAGTLDELRASMWIAKAAREAGLEPAGDDGTYFQFWPMRRVRISEGSEISLGNKPLALWRDVVVTTPVTSTVDLPVVFVGEGQPDQLANVDLHGKAVAAVVHAPTSPPAPNMSLRGYRYALAAVRQQSQALIDRGAGAVILVSDSVADDDMAFGFGGVALARGRYGLDTARSTLARGVTPNVPVLWVRRGMLDGVRAPGQRLTVRLYTESFSYPSVNVVAKVGGMDPARRHEYVLFSGHQDHDGVRYPIDGDSIWNGADDNASVSVALLAIARAWAKKPGARSALFVWHGAEERGLLGSYWHALHPVVPLESIVAVLNGDMIGRNNPDSAALLGAQPPHRNSTALARMALEANDRVTRFAIDSSWDRPTHREGWYYRSDHLPYACMHVPALFFSTLLHPDYHTPRDEPQRIDIAKLARMTRWMYATGWSVASVAERPALDTGFQLERRCAIGPRE
ncbi:MAG: peptidase M28 [Gemmatimonadetes bacterium]|nr:MAG: peptidase M28 [Gemmatimonadota bacterium]